MDPYKIVLADDHNLLRQGLKRIISDIPELKVVGEAADGLALLNLLKKSVPDLIVLDISMPNLRGIEATREIKMICPGVKVLILTMHRDKEYLEQAMAAGAEGYLLKDDADTELFSAIHAIRQGRTYISPFFSGELTTDWVLARRGRYKVQAERVTTREREILKMIAEGKSSKEIAELLFISNRTVEQHRANLMRKLALKKTAELVTYAIRKGLV